MERDDNQLHSRSSLFLQLLVFGDHTGVGRHILLRDEIVDICIVFLFPVNVRMFR